VAFAPALVGVAFAAAFVGLGLGDGLGDDVGPEDSTGVSPEDDVDGEGEGLDKLTSVGDASGPAEDATGLPAESTDPKSSPSWSAT
jgi:hypothetical protein